MTTHPTETIRKQIEALYRSESPRVDASLVVYPIPRIFQEKASLRPSRTLDFQERGASMARNKPDLSLAATCALTLLLFMAIRIDWARRPSPVSAALETEAVSEVTRTPLSVEEVEPTLKSLLEHHRAALKRLEHNDFFYPGLCLGLGWGLESGTVQARLLAIRYPRETEAFAFRIVGDAGAGDSDHRFAAKVLGILASRGSQASFAALVKLAQDGSPPLVPIALRGLAACDRDGRYRELYPNACKRDIREAFDAGPYWVDPPTKQTLEEILAQNLKIYDDDYCSREALARMRILESPQRDTLLEQLVAGEHPNGTWDPAFSWQRQQWALRVIEGNPTPRALDVLRRRLDREEKRFAEFDSRFGGGPTHPGWTQTSDYNEFLVAYFALGGQLNAVETERLRYYGYLSDPDRRLRELLSRRRR